MKRTFEEFLVATVDERKRVLEEAMERATEDCAESATAMMASVCLEVMRAEMRMLFEFLEQ